MNFRTLTPLALILAVLLAATAASLASGTASADLTPRAAAGQALRAL
jgi:hypothetical protein